MSGPEDLSAVHRKRAEGRLGQTLRGKYKLLTLLGMGGMCAVYKAVHRNGHKVALKMLHLELSLDEDARRRFLKEGYAANNVEHPSVVRVTDDDIAEDGSVFVVMELLEGETLEELADKGGGRLPHFMVMNAAHQLLDVLAAAEEKGVLHRDIKPANLFWTHDGTLKLLDFGIARTMDTDSAAATASGRVFGTPAFMSPEQAMGKRSDIDHRSDLWAVGATMFTLLTGRFVHDEAETAMQQMLHTASRAAPRVSKVAKGIPQEVSAIVDKALAFDKNDRFQDARSMQKAIEDVYPKLYGSAPPPKRSAGRFSIPSPMPLGGVPMPRLSSSDTLDQAATLPRSSMAPMVRPSKAGMQRKAAILGALGLLLGLGVWLLSRGAEDASLGTVQSASLQADSAAAPPQSAAAESPAPSISATAPAPSASSHSKSHAPAQAASSKRGAPGKKATGKGAFDYQ